MPAQKQPQPYTKGFWSPDLKPLRAIYFKVLAFSVLLTIITIWSCLSVYWASVAHETGRLVQINAVFVNRDIANGVNGTLGNTVRETVFQSLNQTHHLGWTEEPSSKVPTRASIEQALVEDEWAWVFLVVGENATQNLTIARENGISTYNPRDAITIYYNQARNEQASGKVLPMAQQLAQQGSQQASAQMLGQYLTQQGSNATAMANLAAAPQTASNAFGISTVNFRPFNQPVASAVTLVGLIYLTILAFIQTMAHSAVRPLLEKHLTLSSYIGMRILVPLCLYVVISLLFAMLNLPWDLHWDAHFSNTAKGFFCTYALFLVGMSALGLATEAIITVIGPKFMAYALVALIISNVSVAAIPVDLQVWFFKYYPAMVYYHINRGIRCIIFNTKNELGLNFGVCLAWVVFSVCTLSGFTALFRHLDIKKAKKEAEEQQGEHKA
ncbi:Nitrosoguanidine resistance protein SNG1 [Wallemia ichthyophaga EXF-994]|uniref:Nitrosoguanidine resistance protein SNG1 n=2 Tax=Wallemia ichthyophaga TaxID=245174 RepID=R9AXK8_WALI9|nr:Nitrosoguanidine resistance protein SNG1 [Wallemia ichthyophaga EXF-994]EOR04816.1 Nitrosoguanidine resistance protein SNG1 [Wallemia ichthyophaga EXF-994]